MINPSSWRSPQYVHDTTIAAVILVVAEGAEVIVDYLSKVPVGRVAMAQGFNTYNIINFLLKMHNRIGCAKMYISPEVGIYRNCGEGPWTPVFSAE